MSEGEELSARLAKALDRAYKIVDGFQYWQIHNEPKHDWQEFGIGWGIVEVVVAAIEAKGWSWSLMSDLCAADNNFLTTERVYAAIVEAWTTSAADMPTALCLAFVAAVEAQEGRR